MLKSNNVRCNGVVCRRPTLPRKLTQVGWDGPQLCRTDRKQKPKNGSPSETNVLTEYLLTPYYVKAMV